MHPPERGADREQLEGACRRGALPRAMTSRSTAATVENSDAKATAPRGLDLAQDSPEFPEITSRPGLRRGGQAHHRRCGAGHHDQASGYRAATAPLAAWSITSATARG